MKSSAICREWLKSLPPTQGYLKKEQSIGRELLLKKGMPSNKDEAWRLCNLKKLNSFLSLPIIINNKDFSSKLKYIFPEKEKDRERIIIQPTQNQSININLPNGIEKLNDREIEEHLGKIVKSMDIKNDISVFLNQASSAELLALKVKSNINES